MTQAALTPALYADAVVEGDSPDFLNNIWSDDCGVAVYRRRLGALLQSWLDTLPADKLPQTRLSLRTDQVRDALVSLCQEKGIVDDPCCQMLIGDINSLAQFFAHVMKVTWITLRLDVVNDNACRKFHQDNVAARLLCTYRGQGTEFGACFSGPEPDAIQELPPGSAGIFKGRRWPSQIPSVIYHRSPQIGGTGETRLLLVIDASTCDDDCSCC